MERHESQVVVNKRDKLAHSLDYVIPPDVHVIMIPDERHPRSLAVFLTSGDGDAHLDLFQ